MKMAFVMNPLDKVKPHKDTTYFLMLAAAERGHEVYYLDQRDLSVQHDRVCGMLTEVDVCDDPDRPFAIGERRATDMAGLDVVWIRTDPPVDRTYVYTTLLLDLLPDTTRIVNRPAGIRNWNEKLAALHFPQFTPRTLVSCDRREIEHFVQQFSRCTIKPIDGHGGGGIVFVGPADRALAADIHAATHNGRHWVIVQEYLPAARQGDKRILLLNGDPLGAVLRLHADGVELNNLDAGGSASLSTLTDHERDICAVLKPALLAQGIVFSGIDIIGGKLIEINVTSPTVLCELSRFSGEPLNHRIIESVE